MLSNAALAIAIENINGLPNANEELDEEKLIQRQNTYFAFILYSTFGLALVRFTGVSLFSFHPPFFNTDSAPVSVLLLQAQSVQMLPKKLSAIERAAFPYIHIPDIISHYVCY